MGHKSDFGVYIFCMVMVFGVLQAQSRSFLLRRRSGYFWHLDSGHFSIPLIFTNHSIQSTPTFEIPGSVTDVASEPSYNIYYLPT